LKQLSQDLEANVLCYNYRSVGMSRGELLTQDDLIHDGVTIIQSLQKRGVKSGNIAGHGFSLGGLVLSHVAEHVLREDDFELHQCNERSGYSVPDAMHAHSVVWYLFSWFFVACNWTLNTAVAFSKLQNRTKVLIMSNPYDTVFLHPAQAVDAL